MNYFKKYCSFVTKSIHVNAFQGLLHTPGGGKFVCCTRDLWHGIQPFSVYFGAGESKSLAQKKQTFHQSCTGGGEGGGTLWPMMICMLSYLVTVYNVLCPTQKVQNQLVSKNSFSEITII